LNERSVRDTDVKPSTAIIIHDPHTTGLSRGRKDTRPITVKNVDRDGPSCLVLRRHA